MTPGQCAPQCESGHSSAETAQTQVIMFQNVGLFIDNGDNPLIDSYCISDYQTSVNSEHDRGVTADLSHSI